MLFNVRVVTRSSFARIERQGNLLKVHLTKPAVEGAANSQLVELLSDHFKIKKYQVSIKNGLKSRDKLVQIDADV